MSEFSFDSLKKLDNLPEIDTNTARLLEVILNPDVTHKHVISLIEQNINLSAHLLKMANSVKYTGKFGSIKSISHALTRLGLVEVGKICLVLTAKNSIPIPGEVMDKNLFWEHSIQVAKVTRVLVEGKPSLAVDPGMAYIAGLFHDVGKVILNTYFPEECARLKSDMESFNKNIFNLEDEILGMDHGEVGGYLLKLWGFPEDICSAVSFHHKPDYADADYKSLAQIVHLADFYTSIYGGVEPLDILPTTCSQGALNDLGFESDYLMGIVVEVKKEVEDSKDYLD